MARHKKKEKLVKPQENVQTIVEPWPNLPQKLLNLIGKQYHLMQNISFGGVAKSWRVNIRVTVKDHGMIPGRVFMVVGSIMAGGNDSAEYTLLIPTVRNCYWRFGVFPFGITQFHSNLQLCLQFLTTIGLLWEVLCNKFAGYFSGN
ncbi:hypothetical protein MTR67_006062 [Solanum verrucosum]|uniref:Uncharacterized protein n=1 Tax=Solanum verrucosum TaxID=315347 RepID=A0AAF0PXJ6_SOLVR|nr:hypothetical protein MTR67_006062 [Solanum verrucosum]